MHLMAATSSIVVVIVFFLATVVGAAIVEHTFVVHQMYMRHMCKDTLATVVNGQFPGPAVDATEGDTVVVHVVNESPHGITIHWHGVKQTLSCWADGAGMVTQCPIQPNTTFTYRFVVSGQEGTLWWHAHVSSLRATLHGIITVQPKPPSSYPFPKPYMDVPIIIGEWWQQDLTEVDNNFLNGNNDPVAATINGNLGDLYNCSGVVEDSFVLEVDAGETYLLRLVNAALFSEYYFKVAGHKLTVVGADANYVKPFTTDVVAVAPGETVDVLLLADAPPSARRLTYYMVAMSTQAPEPDPQVSVFVSRGVLRYKNVTGDDHDDGAIAPPRVWPPGEKEQGGGAMVPTMPDHHDSTVSFSFHGNLTGFPGRRHLQAPLLSRIQGPVDERLFITLGQGSICRRNGARCERGGRRNESRLVAYMNNVSFHLPEKAALLGAWYHNNGDHAAVTQLEEDLPSTPPRTFNFTDPALIPVVPGGKMEALEPTRKATTVRRVEHNTAVEVVFQSTAAMQSDSNPMHLHGHDFFVLAHGRGNHVAARDEASYNLVDPPLKNTVQVPRLGWAAIRFVADNPGAWFMHCHFEYHLATGMATVFHVRDGPTPETTLPPPPPDLPKCSIVKN